MISEYKDNTVSAEKSVTLKELRQTFYDLRNFEISRLWERSIFLTAFLTIISAGYGYLANTLLTGNLNEIGVERLPYIHEACLFLTSIAIVFSIIWIKMAKASKAWYEVYEEKIKTIEENDELAILHEYRMKLEGYHPKKLDTSLLTNNPGAYSVSKINIVIGIILLAVWTLLFGLHYSVLVKLFCNNTCNPIHLFALVIFPIIITPIYLTAWCNLWVKSSALCPE